VEDRASGLSASDEDRHSPTADTWWHETWVFEAGQPDGSLGLTTALTLLPGQRRAWYWAVLVRAGAPLVHVAELHAGLPTAGLTVRTAGLWADHVCESPFEQWTVTNEAHAVALDDPADAIGRAYGDPVPVAFDLEWYATGPAQPRGGGYEQPGEVDGVVELPGGPMPVVAPGRRRHWWGTGQWWPVGEATARPDGLRAPVALVDASGPWVLERVLTPSGWWEGVARA
jgi:hypothetical protein